MTEIAPIPSIPAKIGISVAIIVKDVDMASTLRAVIEQRIEKHHDYDLTEEIPMASMVISDDPQVLAEIESPYIVKMLVFKTPEEKRVHQERMPDTRYGVTRTEQEVTYHFLLTSAAVCQ